MNAFALPLALMLGCVLLALGLAASFFLKRAGRKAGLDESDTGANA